jgi:hypothetical protein
VLSFLKYFFASSKNTCIYSPCRELSYRAILRNLKLLTGQRGEKKSFEVLLAGVSSSTIAQFLKVYEPNLEVNIFGVDEFVNVSNLVSSSIVKEKQKFDSIILTQPYHSIHSSKDLSMLRGHLDKDYGSIGLVWHRATTENENIVSKFNSFARKHKFDNRDGFSLPRMNAEDHPLKWVETNLDHDTLAGMELKPIKHRKFVETLKSETFAPLIPYLYATSDVRFASMSDFKACCNEFSKEFENDIQNSSSISFDFHAFHTSVIA